ncbi:MAG: RDD family protein [Planctomycetota bacterium]
MPPAPGLVRSIRGAAPGEQVLFLAQSGEDSSFVELVRLDDQLRPLGSTYLQRAAGASARVDGKLYLFGADGATALSENLEEPSANPAFEIDRFLGRDLTERVLDAASDGNKALIAGLEEDGTLGLTLFDGVGFQELAPPDAGEPVRGEEVAVGLAGVGRFHVVLRAGMELWTGVVSGERLSWRGSVRLRSAGDGLVLFAAGELPEAWLLDRTDDGETDLVRVALGEDGSPVLPVRRRQLSVGDGARLVGVAESDRRGSRDESLVALVAEGDSLRIVSAARVEEPGSRPMFLVAWAANWSRFEKPLGLQVGLFVLLGLFSRRLRDVRRTHPAAGEPEAAAVMLKPAGLVRRILAFAVDVVLLFFLFSVVYYRVLDPNELEYVDFSFQGAMEGAQQAGDSRVIISAALDAMLQDAMLLFVLLFTGVLAFADLAFGRSPGKSLLGLRVVALNGAAPSAGAATTRSLMLLLDWFWSFGLVGMALVTFTRRRQRLGDLMAGTMVIRDGEAGAQPAEPAE